MSATTRRRAARLGAVAALTLSSVGYVHAGTASAAGPIVVPRDYPTIQEAVNAAPAGGTVVVSAGSYTGQVSISKNLTLRGAGASSTRIVAPAALSPYAFDGSNTPIAAVVVARNGAKVAVSGLTVAGDQPCDIIGVGLVAIQGSTLNLSSSRVQLRPAASCYEAWTYGVVFGAANGINVAGSDGTTGFGKVTGTTVTGYTAHGLLVVGPAGSASKATFSNNFVDGGNLNLGNGGISALFNAVATITDNTVTGNECNYPGCGPDPINQFQPGGVLIAIGARATVQGNHIYGNDIGIYQVYAGDCCTIRDNRVNDNRYYGIAIQDGNGRTSDNTITGGQYGILAVADGIETTATSVGDKISGATASPTGTLQCCGFTAAIVRTDE